MAHGLGLVLDLSYAGFVAATDAEGNPLARRWRPPGARYDDIGDWAGEALGAAGGGFPDLEWICVGLGPGSFTGIRIAMAFAQGLALPRALPLRGFTSFAPLILSTAPATGKRRVVAIPANAGRFYVALDLDVPGSILSAEELTRLRADAELIAPADVPAFDSVRAAFGSVHAIADGWDVAGLAQYARTSGLEATRPHYLQPSAAEIKNSGLALRSGETPAAADYSIRAMSLSDAESVAALERICNPMPWAEKALRAHAAEGVGPANRKVGVVAERAGEVAGYLCADGLDEAEILVFGVAPEARRHGIGRALLAHLLGILRRRKCGAVFLEVRRGNAAALSLYRSAGFEETGVRRGYYSDTGEDAVLMRGNLAPGIS